ncbi:hypothetical protein CXG81DRAFT_23336 [Caulochytrium protostelioides]|uniref:histidine--tRNA ligase n=2 Tax=Caulochytrium protostelioides TaxID=1555241 RepID=A0A4V1IVH5_9FUNG|nr:hypothetical protein CXG81DRAFT_23336 [Caulochytrium protostelioides]|eukprot:RKP04079.1 hypothetical protein CXG81DRAFT_23336 [Caulochytrium protostelioides]
MVDPAVPADLAALTAQYEAVRQRVKDTKKSGDAAAQTAAIEDLKQAQRTLSAAKDASKAAAKAAAGSAAAPGAAAGSTDAATKAPVKADPAAAAALSTEAETASSGYVLKVPKGTRDYLPKEMAIRERMFDTIRAVFKRHGGVTIDTPVFELRDILMGKYGEDSKLIYDLQDQGGELCSLRYDLTVPFARFLAMNTDLSTIKRYHIGKVYRRDQPSVNKGRMREFFQTDWDIAGIYDPMIPDAECVRVMVEILTDLKIPRWRVKINHRKILDGMFDVCGVPEDKIRAISSAVDKLDKMAWAEVRKEMIDEKGLDPQVADRIGEYVKLSGLTELVDTLAQDPRLKANARAQEGVEDMRLLFRYLEIYGVMDKVVFDLSLARGLDYYTGIIYEAVLLPSSEAAGEDDLTVGVGSIAAGGRYDNLVGMFSNNRSVPCVGVSIGVERVFAILSRMEAAKASAAVDTRVYVCGMGKGDDLCTAQRMKLASELWDAGIAAEFMFKTKPRMQAQFDYVDANHIPIVVNLFPKDVAEGIVTLKCAELGVNAQVPRGEVVAEIQKLLPQLA